MQKIHTRQTADCMSDPRFHQLLDLAAEGNSEAIQDLWLQYQYDYLKKGRGHE